VFNTGEKEVKVGWEKEFTFDWRESEWREKVDDMTSDGNSPVKIPYPTLFLSLSFPSLSLFSLCFFFFDIDYIWSILALRMGRWVLRMFGENHSSLFHPGATLLSRF
jgi:hypothetical protein